MKEGKDSNVGGGRWSVGSRGGMGRRNKDIHDFL